MKYEVEQLLQQALSPNEQPDDWLNQNILRTVKENENMKKRKLRISTSAAVAVMTLLVASLGAFAGWKYLAPQKVARVFADESLAKAFESEDAILINETQEYGGYMITLLGIVSGKDLSEYTHWDDEGNVISDRTYIVTAIENADGTPRPDVSEEAFGEDSFYVSPYVQGISMWKCNAHTLGGGYSEDVVDGIQYRIFEIGNVEIFAKRSIYLGVNEGSFYNPEAFVMDEMTGEIMRNEAYEGLNALFELPIPAFKGDEAAVEAFLDKMEAENSQEESEEISGEMTEIAKVEQKIMDWTLDDFLENGECVYKEELIVDENDYLSYEYELEMGSASEAKQNMNYLFEKKQTGAFEIATIYGSGDILVETFEILADGKVMLRVFKIQ